MSQIQPSLLRRIDQTGTLIVIVRLVLGGYFLWSGMVKIIELPSATMVDPVKFLKVTREYQILPEDPATSFFNLNNVAIVLPSIEVVCGIALLLGCMVRGASFITAVMLVPFTIAILMRAWGVYQQGTPFMEIKFDCGCGGGPIFIWKKMVINPSLFLLSLVGMWSHSQVLSISSLWSTKGHSADNANQQDKVIAAR